MLSVANFILLRIQRACKQFVALFKTLTIILVSGTNKIVSESFQNQANYFFNENYTFFL